jgi:hypothetical protein
VAHAAYTILGHDRDGQPQDIAWRTPHMPALGGTVMLPDRGADPEHPWRAMAVTGIAHYPNRTEVVLAAADELGREAEGEIFAQASEYAAAAFADD